MTYNVLVGDVKPYSLTHPEVSQHIVFLGT